jgi:hypothetical protein
VKVVAAGVVVIAPILPDVRSEQWRAVWWGAAISVGATLVLTVVAASLESTINGPGRRSVAEPVLWALGGGVGIALGSVVTAWITRRVGMAALAGLGGAAALLVLLIVAYNSTDLRFEDQLVGTLIIVVLPAYIGALACATVVALLARAFDRRSPAVPSSTPTTM